MIFLHRRKPLARIFLFGFAGVMAGGNVVDALAQASAPLRVDPVLLGLPAIKPADPVEPVRAKVDAAPVEAPVIERRSLESAPPARDAKAPEARPSSEIPPTATPAAAKSTAPMPVVEVPVAIPVRPLNADVGKSTSAAPVAPRRPVAPAVVVDKPRPASGAPEMSTLGPLRVDPLLLGLPPLAASPSAFAAGSAAEAANNARLLLAKAPATGKKAKDDSSTWYKRLWVPVSNAYARGSLELLLPLETYHLRSAYSAEKIATYQEKPKGFGLGRGFYNEKGDWEGVYALAFQDSHFKPMYMAGYGWQSIWRPFEDTRVGLGYVAGLMSRTDILGYKPFPLAVPAASIAYKNFSLNGVFIPGGAGWGNVAFFWAKWELGKDGERVGTPARPMPAVDETELAATTLARPERPLAWRVPYGPVLAATGETTATASASAATSPAVAGGVAESPAAAGRGVPVAGSAEPLLVVAGDAEEAPLPDTSPALTLKATRVMTPLERRSETPRPVFLSAQRMGGEVDREFNAEGEAEMRRVGMTLNGDRLTYWPIEDEVEVEGHVRLEENQSVVTGPKMRLRIEDQIGYFEEPSFFLKNQPKASSQKALDNALAERSLEQQSRGDYWNSGFAVPQAFVQNYESLPTRGKTMSDGRGDAERMDFEGENHYRLFNSAFTTCSPGNDDWYLKTAELELDYDQERGDGKKGTLYFKDVPIFYSPWVPFSLNKQRKSGLLAPTFGSTSNSGMSLSLPFYWDIAPNMDATITTREMIKRGLQVNTNLRYMGTANGGTYVGESRIELLPGDKVKSGDSRYGISLVHRQMTGDGFSSLINYNKVSDSTYFTDLSSNIAVTSQTQLLQQAQFAYAGGGWWSATANFQQYQTLQPDTANTVAEQYRMLPQLAFNARKPDLYGTDSSFLGQYTAFTKPQQIINGVKVSDPEGQRLVLYPQMSIPYVTPGWYVTPKLGLNMRQYTLSRQTAGAPTSISSTLPIASVDSGMTFERSSQWFGRDYTQTLEPRLYYLNIPYKNQDTIPVFDAALADFNFAQIFSENQFSGWDRINSANQLTAAATSRLLDPKTGAEIVRVMFGERFYFSRNQVGLSANSLASSNDRSWDRSDFLSAFSGQILPKVYADLAMQYNLSDQQFKRQSVGVRYLPEPGKVFNAAYRYNADASAPTNQVDFSTQWPLATHLYGVGRLNYSFRDTGTTTSTGTQGGRLVQAVAGIEYNGGCWVVRGVIQRSALTSSSTSSAFFIQLELNDFASVGSNPISMLRRNIQGYGLINEPATASSDYLQ